MVEPSTMARRFPHIASLATATLVALLASGCSDSKKEPKTPDDVGADSDPAPRWDSSSAHDEENTYDARGRSSSSSSSEDGSSSDDGGSDESAPRKRREQEDDYDMTYADCKVLARTYRNAWYHDEIEKLNSRKLPEKHFKKAEANVEQAANDGGENWLQACNTTVGSPQLRSRLKCASRAKTLQRFNDCMDGKVE
jgi:hypothetical protein